MKVILNAFGTPATSQLHQMMPFGQKSDKADPPFIKEGSALSQGSLSTPMHKLNLNA